MVFWPALKVLEPVMLQILPTEPWSRTQQATFMGPPPTLEPMVSELYSNWSTLPGPTPKRCCTASQEAMETSSMVAWRSSGRVTSTVQPRMAAQEGKEWHSNSLILRGPTPKGPCIDRK